MMQDILSQTIAGKDLSMSEACRAMDIIMAGEASDAQIGAFLTALRIKGETSEEVAGFAATMRKHALSINCQSRTIIDTCGTGGDCKGTFNISTTVAFVLAGAGVKVAKHGNRSVSSACGSADVLTALGVKVDLPPAEVGRAIDEIGIGFLYAPVFHRAMKFAAGPRKELGFRTVFNLLGPLTNPAGTNCQLVGVYDEALTEKVADALVRLGAKRALVVHSRDGMDEISTAAPTRAAEVKDGVVKTYLIQPEDVGLPLAAADSYLGGTPEQNAQLVRDILKGELGPKRDIVLINAAGGLLVADKVATLRDGIAMATASINSGAALAKLEALIDFTVNGGGRLPLS